LRRSKGVMRTARISSIRLPARSKIVRIWGNRAAINSSLAAITSAASKLPDMNFINPTALTTNDSVSSALRPDSGGSMVRVREITIEYRWTYHYRKPCTFL